MAFGRYTPDSRGMSELRNSAVIGTAMVQVAQQFQQEATSRGHSRYEARGLTVRGGHNNTERAGAEIVEVDRDHRDVRDRLLVNLSRDFRMRRSGA